MKLIKPARMAALFMVVLTGSSCGGATSGAKSPAGEGRDGVLTGAGPVSVLYAGTLAGIFEHQVKPSFERQTGFTFQGEGKGSIALANLIRDGVRTPDVFISADPSVNSTLMGQGNGDLVGWWMTFASSELVVGWSPSSRFASAFHEAQAGRRSWTSVLLEPGLRLGRTDPEIDPKGYRTVIMMQLEERRAGDPTLSRRILGSPGNPAQVFLEEQLVARVQAGELDAGVFFKVEAIEAGLPFLSLPREINQGDPQLADEYARAHYTTAKGQERRGSPIVYTLTIPGTVRNRAGAISFCQFLLSSSGRAVLVREGLSSVVPTVGGDPARVPAELRKP